jgi:hypothetical protein
MNQRIPARQVDPAKHFTVGEAPTKELMPDVYVLLRVDLKTDEAEVLTYCYTLDDAGLLLEKYAGSYMAFRASRDPSFPQVSSTATTRYDDPLLHNQYGGVGMNALSFDEVPYELMPEGEYVMFFEPEPDRIVLERKDAERIYVARKPHPDDDEKADYMYENLAYFSISKCSMNILDFLRAETDISRELDSNEVVLSDIDHPGAK